MAVAILEKRTENLEKIESSENVQFRNGYVAREISDEQHNAQIGATYAKLINPNAGIDEILGRTQAMHVEDKEVESDGLYLVENARADAEIFRADSPINRRVVDVQPVYAEQTEEEEDEELRPTPTTMQYKTYGIASASEEGKINTRSTSEKSKIFSKKEKIAIAVVISVIVAMFVLIIVNSAILSGISSDMSSLQSSLTDIKASYASVSDEVNDYLANAVKNAEQFAILSGLIK